MKDPKNYMSDTFSMKGQTMITANYDLEDLESKDAPLGWQLAGRQYTRTGYGGKIPSTRMVKLLGGKRWRRVYIAQWSNMGTAYVPNADGSWNVIR